MPSTPDEPTHFGRTDRHARRRPDGGQACVQKQFRAYRVVKRYRGDRQAWGFAPEGWPALWRLQPGDTGWPSARTC
jgi:hypothetical protein